jgi:ribonuclease VapC
MVIDTSAIVALLCQEPEAGRLASSIEADPVRLISAVTLVEISIVLESRYGEPASRELDLLLAKAGIRMEPVDEHQSGVARMAWRRFGKGRHAASLNFGDCFSYALAKAKAEPLLFKGTDFLQTDVAAARY